MRIYEPLRGSLGCPARRACQRGLWWREAAEKLSIAAEAWHDVAAALDAAMDRAGAEMGR